MLSGDLARRGRIPGILSRACPITVYCSARSPSTGYAGTGGPIDIFMKNKRVRFKKLMVANRSEIAIRVMRAANELGLRTVAIYSNEDRFALHRFKADEAYQVGSGSKPLAAYLDIDGILSIAITAGGDAIHPGYGFLAENPEFAARCEAAGITFIGPGQDVMRAASQRAEIGRAHV